MSHVHGLGSNDHVLGAQNPPPSTLDWHEDVYNDYAVQFLGFQSCQDLENLLGIWLGFGKPLTFNR